MPADPAPIVTAARQRHELTRAKVLKALRELDRAGTPVTFQTVAAAAGVSRSWLYTQPDIRTDVQRLREATRRAPGRPTHLGRVRAGAAAGRRRTQQGTGRGQPAAAPPARPGAGRTTPATPRDRRVEARSHTNGSRLGNGWDMPLGDQQAWENTSTTVGDIVLDVFAQVTGLINKLAKDNGRVVAHGDVQAGLGGQSS